MAFMEWGEAYNVNVREIDHQHRQLVTLINELHDAIEDGGGRSTIDSLVNELETMVSVLDPK